MKQENCVQYVRYGYQETKIQFGERFRISITVLDSSILTPRYKYITDTTISPRRMAH